MNSPILRILATALIICSCSTENTVPRITNISINGIPQVDEVLMASYDYEDDENDLEAMTLFQWYRADDSTGSNETLIIGATDSLYTLDLNDENLFVRVKITPIAESGANPGLLAESNYFGPINAAPPSNVMNPITGKVWLDKNLGASRVALSKTDVDSYGALFQWGRAADGHENRNSGTTTQLSYSDNPGHSDFIIQDSYPWNWRSAFGLPWQGVNGVNNPCPSGYRLPTEAEMRSEFLSWSSQDLDGAYGSALKLPAGGSRYHNDGLLKGVGWSAGYWTSTTTGAYTKHLVLNNDTAFMYPYGRANGFSVRCIMD